MLRFSAGLIIAYLLGAVPFGYVMGRYLRSIDLRDFGSGNIGATNALRTLGKKPGIIVLILDLLKGLLAVVLVAPLLYTHTAPVAKLHFMYLLGICAIIGHDWTVFLKFHGGKGVSTTLGVLIGLSFIDYRFAVSLGALIAVWVIVVLITKYVSLASIISACSLPLIMLAFRMSYFDISFAAAVGFLILIRHKGNIKRLIAGRENKLKL